MLRKMKWLLQRGEADGHRKDIVLDMKPPLFFAKMVVPIDTYFPLPAREGEEHPLLESSPGSSELKLRKSVKIHVLRNSSFVLWPVPRP